MSDALCGPSNPLQQFKQQTQSDRSLQQDRLTGRHLPSQGFRSADPNAGRLDPEFEAFQAGLPPSDFAHLQSLPQVAPGVSGPTQAPSWANDFTRMHISSPPPFNQQLPHHPAPADTSNWAQSFQQHISQTVPRQTNSSPSQLVFQPMVGYGMNGFQSSFTGPALSQPMHSKGKAAAAVQTDDAAFERAFDQAREALLAADQAALEPVMPVEQPAYARGVSTGGLETPKQSLHTDIDEVSFDESTAGEQGFGTQAGDEERSRESIKAWTIEDHQRQLMMLEQQNKRRLRMARQEEGLVYRRALPLERLESDPIAEEMLRADQSTTSANAEQAHDSIHHDDDALAMTAQELLQKVDHNQTDKFRNSQFLALMRKLRDREVKVEGDKMVETASASSQTAPVPLYDVHIDNSEQIPRPVQTSQPSVDAAPFDYQSIPPHEQDHDAGRYINPRDGQEVVDLLNQPTTAHDEDHTHDIDSEFGFTTPVWRQA